MDNTENPSVDVVVPRYKNHRLYGAKIGPRWCVLGRIFKLKERVADLDLPKGVEGMLVGVSEVTQRSGEGVNLLVIWWGNPPYQPVVNMFPHEVQVRRPCKNPWRDEGFGFVEQPSETRPLVKLDPFKPIPQSPTVQEREVASVEWVQGASDS